jgi:hypothetical protein
MNIKLSHRRLYVFRQELGRSFTWPQEQELMIPEPPRVLQWLSDVSLWYLYFFSFVLVASSYVSR